MLLSLSDLVPGSLENIIQLFFALMGAYAAAFWFGLVIWTFRDIQKRSRDAVVQVLATLLVLFTGVLGAVLYMILRPPDTLAETYQRTLEEEAILREMESSPSCPQCQHVVEADFVRCPHCGAGLRKRCAACDHPLDIRWEICPYCGADQVERPTSSPAHADSEAVAVGPTTTPNN